MGSRIIRDGCHVRSLSCGELRTATRAVHRQICEPTKRFRLLQHWRAQRENRQGDECEGWYCSRIALPCFLHGFIQLALFRSTYLAGSLQADPATWPLRFCVIMLAHLRGWISN